MVALDPLSLYPDFDDDVGGSEWFRTTVIASDLFERCPGRAWVRNVTEYAPTWKCKTIHALNTPMCSANEEIDRWNAIIPAELAEAPWEGSKSPPSLPFPLISKL